MIHPDRVMRLVCGSVKRALEGQTPGSLRAYSFAVDQESRVINLKAHFAQPPSEDDLEAISIVETEVDADFLDHLLGVTSIEVAGPGSALSLLPGGVAYLRDGEDGEVCAAP